MKTKIQYFTASQFKLHSAISPGKVFKVSAIFIAIPTSFLPLFPINTKTYPNPNLSPHVTYLLHQSSIYSTVRTETTLTSKVMMIWIEISELLFQSRHLRNPINIKENSFISWVKYLHCCAVQLHKIWKPCSFQFGGYQKVKIIL